MMGQDRLLRREALLLLGIAAVQIGGTLVTSQHQPDRDLPLGGLALLVLGVAAVPLRLARPVAALGLAFASTLAYVTLGYARGPVFASLILTFGNAVVQGHRRIAIAKLVAGYFAFSWLGVALGREDPPSLAAATGLAAWLLVLYTACELIRARRDRAKAQARARADAAERQIANERLAIARELHDVVAHNMSLINLQAGVALQLSNDLPGPEREALETIKTASKGALVELRSILGVLRHVDDGAPRAPAPGLAAVRDLVARSEAPASTSPFASTSTLTRCRYLLTLLPTGSCRRRSRTSPAMPTRRSLQWPSPETATPSSLTSPMPAAVAPHQKLEARVEGRAAGRARRRDARQPEEVSAIVLSQSEGARERLEDADRRARHGSLLDPRVVGGTDPGGVLGGSWVVAGGEPGCSAQSGSPSRLDVGNEPIVSGQPKA